MDINNFFVERMNFYLLLSHIDKWKFSKFIENRLADVYVKLQKKFEKYKKWFSKNVFYSNKHS